MRIGLDIMVGDFAPRASIKGASLAVGVSLTSSQLSLIGADSSNSTTLSDRAVLADPFYFGSFTETSESVNIHSRAHLQNAFRCNMESIVLIAKKRKCANYEIKLNVTEGDGILNAEAIKNMIILAQEFVQSRSTEKIKTIPLHD